MGNFLDELEMKEVIDKLAANGYQEIISAFLLNERLCYTKKGRLNQSGACRVLNFKPKDLKQALRAMKEVLDPTPVEEQTEDKEE